GEGGVGGQDEKAIAHLRLTAPFVSISQAFVDLGEVRGGLHDRPFPIVRAAPSYTTTIPFRAAGRKWGVGILSGEWGVRSGERGVVRFIVSREPRNRHFPL